MVKKEKINKKQLEKINKEIAKFMFMVNNKIQILNKKYYKITGLYVGSFSSAGFSSGEINYYKLNKN